LQGHAACVSQRRNTVLCRITFFSSPAPDSSCWCGLFSNNTYQKMSLRCHVLSVCQTLCFVSF